MKICPKCDHPNPEDLSVCEECGANILEVSEDGIDPFIGRVLVGKFRITELIGQGAMGRVYKAIQEPINREVAIKILHQHLVEDKRVAKRFRREAEAASRFTHPNSIGIFDFGETDDGSLYIAMEYITGDDLAEIISKEGGLSPKRIVRIATQTLSALQLAHANSIIHRDLKPENIMLTNLPGQKDFVKVCDFGIAKIQQPPGSTESALTMFGMICGTPYYMSPEQAKGEELDPRTDLYSMGVILYEMITGSVPFTGSTPVEVIARHLTDEPLPPSQARPDLHVPRVLEEVVLRAMSKNRENRYANAQELSEDLERALKEAEFQADLERVLQEAEERPVASPVAPVASPAAPVANSPYAPSSANSSFNDPFPHGSREPSAFSQEKAPSMLPKRSKNEKFIAPSPIDLDELPEPHYGASNKSRLLFLAIFIIGAVLGGYALYRSSQKTHNTIVVSRRVVPKRRSIATKSHSTFRKHKPSRLSSKRRIVKRRIVSSRESREYNREYRKIRSWMRNKGVWVKDFSSTSRRYYFRAKSHAKHHRYKKASKELQRLISLLKGLKQLPRSIAERKFGRLQKRHKKAAKRKLVSKTKLKIVENQLFPKIMRAFMTNKIKTMNRYMNKAFRLLR